MYDKKLKSIAIGIRFRPNFQITDNFGNIINNMTNSTSTMFDSKFFPKVDRGNPNQIILHDYNSEKREIHNKLTINQQMIVLECSVKNIKDSKKVREAYFKELIKKIFKDFNITGIQRIGMLHNFEYTNDELNEKFSNKVLDDTIEDISDINLGFSKKIPFPNPKLNSNHNNFYNVIYQLNKMKGSNLIISLDYQLYYDLPLSMLDQIQYNQFYNTTDKYINSQFDKWVKGYIK